MEYCSAIKKEWSWVIYRDVDGPRTCHIEWRKPRMSCQMHTEQYRAHLSSQLLYWALTLWPTVPNHLGPSTRPLGSAPRPQSLLELIRVASRKPDSPPCLVFSTEATIKAPAFIVSPLLLPPGRNCCSPMWAPEGEGALPLEICECNTLPFQRQHLLVCWFHHHWMIESLYIWSMVYGPIRLFWNSGHSICLGRTTILSWNELSGFFFFFFRKWLTFFLMPLKWIAWIAV